ncbi:hypothetical protein EZL74_05825 [Flavobacterium silvisoli]|uniref:Uncharacterized protein n=1 Tax=Flavobacterium silvisoli TaxID=2529433 RepID=A0A4Q9Z1J8_9FLAO|nr:hypothetical protein [Flavobacterium silvisoli]TBX69934.1 hypothetical protein EZL74_05825 [Flavobacterium silvisoli]
METKDYLKDIQDIKQMMAQSSRFLSLSGLSGVLAGVYCLVGAGLAYKTIYSNGYSFETYEQTVIQPEKIYNLVGIASLVVLLSLSTCILLSYKKAIKSQESFWNSTSKRLVINFAIPLFTGGFFILFLLEKELLMLVAPLMLIFYGLACVNASKYTLGDIRYLGISMIVLGLLSTWFLQYGLLFWSMGFGVCHILYGGIMHFKYERN